MGRREGLGTSLGVMKLFFTQLTYINNNIIIIINDLQKVNESITSYYMIMCMHIFT